MARILSGRTSHASGTPVGSQASQPVLLNLDVSGPKAGLHPSTQEALKSVPVASRAPWHGGCAEVGCVDQIFRRGLHPRGGTSSAVNIGESGMGHGSFREPCSSCQCMLDFLGVKY